MTTLSNKTPKQKTKVFSKKLHYWPVSEKQQVYKLMQEGKTPKQIRLTLFKGDRTVSDRSLQTLMNTLRKTPDWVNHHPKTNTPGNPKYAPADNSKNAVKNPKQVKMFEENPKSELIGVFELDKIHSSFTKYRKDVEDFTTSLTSLIDDKSPFTKEQQERIRGIIISESKIAVRQHQIELLRKSSLTV